MSYRLPVLVALLFFVPVVAAHGGAEASELEVEVLSDEGNDFQVVQGGWDVTQVFVGEAHDAASGPGPAGDGVYLRAELYGVPPGVSPAAQGEWRAEFSFDTPEGTVVRSIRSVDGESFESDFDSLVTSVSDEIVHVERAFVNLAAHGLAPGMVLSNFRVATFVGDQPRDVAPGGVPVAGPVTVPMGGAAVSGSYELTGATRYASATLEMVDDVPTLLVQSLLQKGGQHVDVNLPAGIVSLDPVSVSVKPKGVASFRLDAATIPSEPVTFDITTDVGGRVTVTLFQSAGAPTLLLEGETLSAASAPEGRDVPAAGIGAGLLALGLAAWGRRR